jgi:hypothetical protein
MMFPVEEVCGGKGLVDKCLPSSLYLTMLVIIHWASDFLRTSSELWKSEEGRSPHGGWLDAPD